MKWWLHSRVPVFDLKPNKFHGKEEKGCKEEEEISSPCFSSIPLGYS